MIKMIVMKIWAAVSSFSYKLHTNMEKDFISSGSGFISTWAPSLTSQFLKISATECLRNNWSKQAPPWVWDRTCHTEYGISWCGFVTIAVDGLTWGGLLPRRRRDLQSHPARYVWWAAVDVGCELWWNARIQYPILLS